MDLYSYGAMTGLGHYQDCVVMAPCSYGCRGPRRTDAKLITMSARGRGRSFFFDSIFFSMSRRTTDGGRRAANAEEEDHYIGHNFIGHNYIGHNFIGRNCIGHSYIGPQLYRTITTCAEDGVSKPQGGVPPTTSFRWLPRPNRVSKTRFFLKKSSHF